MLVDVTLALSPRTPIWPGARKPEFVANRRPLPDGGEAAESRFSTIPHAGTHIDAPLHFDRHGIPVDRLDLGKLLGRCRVFEHRGPGHIGGPDLAAMGFAPVRRALFKTANSARLRRGELGEDYVSFLPDAIERLVAAGVEVLGIDGFSIGPYGALSDANHVAWCGAGGVIVEMLDLSAVGPGEYVMAALPLKLEGLEAAPARVVLMDEGDLAAVFTR